MKLDKKEVLTPTVTLFVICLVVAILLAATNVLTHDKIAEMNKQTETAARQVVLPGTSVFEDSPDKTYAMGKDGNNITGYVFTTKAKSYGGDLSVMTGISKDGKVTGVVILSISDTPGLGLNAQKESFRNQYKQPVPAKGFEVIKSGTASTGQISAMTGATITSKAVTECVNEAIAAYQKATGSKAQAADAVTGASKNSSATEGGK
ncbi:MAG TPA: FMN-binding protein [Caproiciproducens sp.]|nr:FMN-binding protein [Caproiciproducens sp.]